MLSRQLVAIAAYFCSTWLQTSWLQSACSVSTAFCVRWRCSSSGFAFGGDAFSTAFCINSSRGFGVVRLRNTKHGQRGGFEDARTINDPFVIALCQLAISGKKPGDRILPFGGQTFRARFNTALRFFRLDLNAYKLYSIRRGGATHDFRSHGQLSRIQIRGSWGSARVCRIYINESLAMMSQVEESDLQRSRFDLYNQRFRAFFSPGTCWALVEGKVP